MASARKESTTSAAKGRSAPLMIAAFSPLQQAQPPNVGALGHGLWSGKALGDEVEGLSCSISERTVEKTLLKRDLGNAPSALQVGARPAAARPRFSAAISRPSIS